MARKIEVGFDPDGIRVSLDRLMPLRKIGYESETNEKHKCIAASIRELGVIEPLIIYPQRGAAKQFIILDGNIRYAILKEMKKPDAFCLVATDDEAYTYNHKVSVVSPIQEHLMILKAIEHGVSEERIAATLNVDVAAIRKKRSLLDGICPEAVKLLKDRRVSVGALRELRRVLPIRQVEMAELMCDMNCYSAPYAESIYHATPEEQRLPEYRTKKDDGVTEEDRGRMRREMQNLQRELKLVEETHSENVLNLVVVGRYVQALLENARVLKYLYAKHPEIIREFQKIIEAPELAGGDPS